MDVPRSTVDINHPQVPLVGGTPINLTLLVTAIYVVTYVMMDPVAGSLAAALVLILHRATFGENQNIGIILNINFYSRSGHCQCSCPRLSTVASPARL